MKKGGALLHCTSSRGIGREGHCFTTLAAKGWGREGHCFTALAAEGGRREGLH